MIKNDIESSEDGFSLLEVIVAFTILAISLAYSVQTISSGTTTFSKSTKLSNVSLAVDDLWVREIRNVNGEADRAGQSDFGLRWQFTSSVVPSSKNIPLYLVRVQISETDTDPNPYRFTYFVSGKP